MNRFQELLDATRSCLKAIDGWNRGTDEPFPVRAAVIASTLDNLCDNVTVAFNALCVNRLRECLHGIDTPDGPDGTIYDSCHELVLDVAKAARDGLAKAAKLGRKPLGDLGETTQKLVAHQDAVEVYLAKNYPGEYLDARSSDLLRMLHAESAKAQDRAETREPDLLIPIGSGDHDDEPAEKEPVEASTDGNGKTPREGKGKRINARMLEVIVENHEARGWTAQRWAEHFKCAKSTVIATTAWGRLREYRKTLRAERAKAKRRRPKASELRRD